MNPKNSPLGRLARRRLYYVFSMNREFEREIQTAYNFSTALFEAGREATSRVNGLRQS